MEQSLIEPTAEQGFLSQVPLPLGHVWEPQNYQKPSVRLPSYPAFVARQKRPANYGAAVLLWRIPT